MATKTLKVTSIILCAGGTCERHQAINALAWDDGKMRLSSVNADGEPVQHDGDLDVIDVSWHHITGIWVVLRNRSRGFYVDITFETSHTATKMDFLHTGVVMDALAGEFLSFLQGNHAGRLKDGRPPSFATSRWAACLYKTGWSARGVRVGFGRFSLVLEVLYAICFFTQLHGLVLARETKLAHAIWSLGAELHELQSELWGNFTTTVMEQRGYDFVYLVSFNFPWVMLTTLWKLASHSANWLMLLMLVQHSMVFFFTVDSCVRTLRATWKSAMAIRSAGQRVHKAVIKSNQDPVRSEPSKKND